MYEKKMDGESRSPVVIRIWLTKVEHQKLRAMAKAHGMTPKQVCQSVADLAVEDEMSEQHWYPLKEGK